MRSIKNILLFQRKIFFISYIIAISFSQFAENKKIALAIIFFFISLFTHLFIYDINNKNKYYFYYNVGLSYNILWFSTITIGFINLFILLIV
ncbi:conserved membrane hypothetical protein [Tenacibaculum amylolyticum]